MKNIQKYFPFFLISFLLFSCEDVVNVDLETASPKLVIDASIKWNNNDNGNNQTIYLSTTTNYYSSSIPKVSGAIVFITNLSSETLPVYNFIETSAGTYQCANFEPVLNNEYQLTVIYEEQTYKATSILMPTPTIEFAEQSTITGFDGKDVIQFKFYFQDELNQDNFYLIGFKNNNIVYPEYGIVTDEFFQGNLMFGLYIDEDLKAGDEVNYSLQGVTEKYSNYMNKLLNIAGNDGGSPFATPPATLRGNIVNQTNIDNYPLGYFHLSEIDSGSYTIE